MRAQHLPLSLPQVRSRAMTQRSEFRNDRSC